MIDIRKILVFYIISLIFVLLTSCTDLEIFKALDFNDISTDNYFELKNPYLKILRNYQKKEHSGQTHEPLCDIKYCKSEKRKTYPHRYSRKRFALKQNAIFLLYFLYKHNIKIITCPLQSYCAVQTQFKTMYKSLFFDS